MYHFTSKFSGRPFPGGYFAFQNSCVGRLVIEQPGPLALDGPIMARGTSNVNQVEGAEHEQ
jgi:hypothetical protein